MTSDMEPMENPFASTHSLSENPFDSPDDHVTAETSYSEAQRASELAAREAELSRREAQLQADQVAHAQKVENLRLHGNKNWPFCASVLPHSSQTPTLELIIHTVYPLIHHSINDEIPEDSRMLIWRLYYLWLILLGTLVVSVVACIFILVAGSSDGGKDLGSSIG